MKTLEFPAVKAVAENRAGERSEADRHWQMAGDRVMLYLRCLHFPAPQALELALAALRAAERTTRPGSGNSPVAEAMQALHRLLGEQRSGIFGHDHSTINRCEDFAPPWPPLHRLPMIPEEMASAHWRSLLANILKIFRRSRHGE